MNKIQKKGCLFECLDDGRVLRVTLSGEIDHHSAVSVRTGIDEQIMKKRPRKLILNLERIDFMDSSGLGLIMGRYGKIQAVGGELLVENPNERVLKIFTLAGLQKKIKIQMRENENEG